MNPKPYSSKQKLAFFINMIICPAKKYKKSTEIIPLASLSYPLLCDVVAFFFPRLILHTNTQSDTCQHCKQELPEKLADQRCAKVTHCL